MSETKELGKTLTDAAGKPDGTEQRNSHFVIDLNDEPNQTVNLREVSEFDRRVREWMAESSRSQMLVD